MVVPVGLDTPHTEVGNNTYFSSRTPHFSPEKSFQAPSKDSNDLIKQIRSSRNPISLKTPRSRAPLADRHNVPNLAPHGEFTPLLKSVTKSNALRRTSKENGMPYTPSILRQGHESIRDSPALPVDSSGIYGGDTGSSFGEDDAGATPVPQIGSSSAASTPLAALPIRDGGGVISDGANMMTLREQENIIKKIGSENWGLKLKIHFLEEQLKKAGPGFSEEALRENTDLKVDRVTMQTELRQYRKTVARAERDLEAYRQQLVELQEKTKQKHAEDIKSEELDQFRQMLKDKEAEVQDLKDRLETYQAEEEEGAVKNLQDEIGDLEADLREKDGILEDREDKIETLKDKANGDERDLIELRDQLTSANERVRALEERDHAKDEHVEALAEAQGQVVELQEKVQFLEETAERVKGELEEAREDKDEAIEIKDRAEADLDELRDEMANKSVNTKGLSRQLEEKCSRLQNELDRLREEHEGFHELLDSKKKEGEELEKLQQDCNSKEERLQKDHEMIAQERDAHMQKQSALEKQVERLSEELQNKTDERNLLQSRHNALTDESAGLQQECFKAQSKARDLEQRWENEEGRAIEQEQALRHEHQREIERLTDELDEIHQHLVSKERQLEAEQETWASERRSLEARRDRAEEQASGLKRTIEKLQETEGTLSSREMKLQEALESEKARHEREEQVSSRQIEELTVENDMKRKTSDELKTELASVREELRVAKREESALDEKVQSLEDEVVVLQSSLEEESERAREDVAAAKKETDGLRRQLSSVKQDLARAETMHAGTNEDGKSSQGDVIDDRAPNEQMTGRLQDIEMTLSNVTREKQGLQDQLANVNIAMHRLRTATSEVEAERDEIKSQLKNMQQQVDDTLRLDQEKLDLRRAKTILESDLGRLKEEKKVLTEKELELEKALDQEMEKAFAEEGRLMKEIDDLRRQLTVASDGRDRELLSSKRDLKRLEDRVVELEGQRTENGNDEPAAGELSIIRHELSDARNKEREYKQREAGHKATIRELKLKTADLERQVHEVEISKLNFESPKSSVGGSGRKNEIIEVRRQLAEAHLQMKNIRGQVKEVERESHSKLVSAERQFQATQESLEREKEDLEQELADCHREREEEVGKNVAAEKSINRLRGKVHQLEKAAHSARLDNVDRTIAEERKDLHEMLKDAKLETEELQIQMSERDEQMQSFAQKEKDLRTRLERVREERKFLTKKANAATTELESLQQRYECAVDKMRKLQENWDADRKSMMQRVRFPNMSVSSMHAGDSSEVANLEREVQEREKRHQCEIKGLARQIMYLRKKCEREEGFRADLAYSKKFFLMQIEMYNACNKLDLELIEEMGISPNRSVRNKTPRLKSVVFMVMATVRMRKMKQEWAGNLKIKESLLKSLELTRKKAKKGLPTRARQQSLMSKA
ncbi:MAG: hypothetical protein M1837_005195 [Sclerophora amabilis]|nr:MAG: hypothetical protein M1837_005195 [Sclerophora amabilis]